MSLVTERILSLADPIPTVVVAFPGLPLLPVHWGCPQMCSSWVWELQDLLSQSEGKMLKHGVKVVSPWYLLDKVPMGSRHDVSSDLAYGFPYTLAYAEALGGALADGVQPRSPAKGIITDLDDTLWRGILGDDGVEGVHWNLDKGSQMHGVYQKALQSLARAGTLVGVASKNDPALVEQAFQRSDLLLARSSVFPLEANWGQKSLSVRRILHAWNVGEESVLFVDDNPSEIQEVQSAFPQMECIPFPKDNPAGILRLIGSLRGRCGKESLSNEDSLRLESLRQGQEFVHASEVEDKERYERLLRESAPILTLCYGKAPVDGRAFELINKTNQFNLNGLRYTEGEWQEGLKEARSLLLVAAYQDRHGPLGKIAVLRGWVEDDALTVADWVMSCRAFGRRIEYQMLRCLFDRFPIQRVQLRPRRTERNGPFFAFLESLFPSHDRPKEETWTITADSFQKLCPPLYHEVREVP